MLLAFCASASLARDYSLRSPNGKIEVSVNDNNGLSFWITFNGKPLLEATGLELNEQSTNILSGQTTTVRHEGDVPFYRQGRLSLTGNQLDLKLRGSFGMQVRAYNEGVAYRFYTTNKGETVIGGELASFQFIGDPKAWLSYSTNNENPFAMGFQNVYEETQLSAAKDKHIFLPATVQVGETKITFLESDVRNYPGMFLKAGEPMSSKKKSMLSARFAHYPKKMDLHKWHGMSYVSDTEHYIAKSKGARTYPWRIMAITESDTEMPTNNLVYALATPNKIGDTSWIKPGKAAWEWWNDHNLKGVPFKAGINTDTYLYYIDFAARYGLQYVVLDEGWYDSNKAELMNPIADVDLQRIVSYGKEKGIGIVLWTVFNVLDQHLDEACRKYSSMGVKGFKVDFLERNDQTAVEMAERIAAACARYHLVVDYHGFYAPTGLNRTYPNVLNFEGVFGMEECRWAKRETDMPRYNVTFPFIRMMAGQVDFTPGAMRNGTKNNWVACYENPVSMGTRCHQAACYVVHDSPFTMLCDAPSAYDVAPDYTRFIAAIPVTWDETRVVQGELGHYIVTARRKGDTWYVAGQTNWDARQVELALDFLGSGTYTASILRDGINANHNAEDYELNTQSIGSSDKLTVQLASGGGFVVKLSK